MPYSLDLSSVRRILRRVFHGFIPILSVLWLFGASERILAQAAPRRTLSGHVPAPARIETPTGRFAATNRLHLAIGLPLRNQAELGELLHELYDPASTNFHKYLTTPEFTERFGPTEEDYQAVTRFAESNGLRVTHTLGSRLVLDVEGGVADVERAFQITLRTYRRPTEQEDFVSPDREPSVPFDLPVVHIGGLSDFSRPHPLVHPARAALKPLTGSAPGGYYAGNDFRHAYAPGVALDGSGQKVGLLELDGYNGRDITNYEFLVGVSNKITLTNVLLDSFGGSAGNNNIEVALDIEMVMCMAPKLSQIIVYEENPSSKFFNPEDVVTRMADDNLAKQMSSSWSWGGAPDPIIDNAFLLMQAQGQSFFQAAGDSDAYTGTQLLDNADQTNAPVGSTNITVVGGTTLTMNGTGASWSSETVWNWASLGGSDANVGSGGGASTYYGIPWWQTNVSMSLNNGSTTMRNIPDVALTADNVFVVYTSGHSSMSGGVGGTSCAAPLWAAFTALVNQQATASGKGTVGFANPAIYQIGASPNYVDCFHDTTTGNNIGTGTAGLYKATNGYDLCTGWGTPNGTNLINALGSSPPYIIQSPVGLTVSNGQVAVLSVIPGGEPPFGYHWELNGTNLAGNGTISGIGSNVLRFASVTTSYAGSYSVIVTNAFGSVTSSVVTLNVVGAPPPPTANFTAGPTIGLAPLTVNFTNSSNGATNYSWNFGDGNVSTSVNPANTYSNAGSYTVTLIAVGAGGTNSVAKTNYIMVTNPPPPTASFSGSPTSGLAPLTVNFANASIGATNYSWNFGDGSSNAAVNPAHTYATVGNYSVTLTAVGAGGTNGLTRANYIVVTNNPPPVVAFAASPTNGGAALTVVFTNLTTGATNYSWDFGDGQSNAAVNPTNVYRSEGSYTVTLTAFGPGGMSALVQSNYIVLSNSSPVLTPIANEVVHPGMTVLFTNSATDADVNQTLMFSLDPGAPASASVDSGTGVFTWTPDGSNANTTNPITVRVTDNGVPPLSAARSFNVTVVPLVFQPVSLSNGVLTVSWGSISGLTYRVQYTTNLAGTNWIDLPSDVTANGVTASTIDSTSTDAQRFYRVVVVP